MPIACIEQIFSHYYLDYSNETTLRKVKLERDRDDFYLGSITMICGPVYDVESHTIETLSAINLKEGNGIFKSGKYEIFTRVSINNKLDIPLMYISKGSILETIGIIESIEVEHNTRYNLLYLKIRISSIEARIITFNWMTADKLCQLPPYNPPNELKQLELKLKNERVEKEKKQTELVKSIYRKNLLYSFIRIVVGFFCIKLGLYEIANVGIHVFLGYIITLIGGLLIFFGLFTLLFALGTREK